MTLQTINVADTHVPMNLFHPDEDLTDSLMDFFGFDEVDKESNEYNCAPAGCCDYAFYRIDGDAVLIDE